MIDSGVGESVCPWGWIPLEPIRKTEKYGMRYRAVGEQPLIKQGEKIAKFKAGTKIASMNFQAMNELKRPLPSATRITAIVMRGAGKESYIENEKTRVRLPVAIENGIYVRIVDVLLETDGSSSQPFQRQA